MSRVERNADIYKNGKPKAVKKDRSAAGRILSSIGSVLMAVVVLMCFSLVIPKVAGYDAYVVVSGSMEPNIPVGSIVFSKECDPAKLVTGDVIVFVDPSRSETPITHRVVSNNTADQTIVTKGDANKGQDVNPATYSNVIGKVRMHIPRIGFLAAKLTSKLGKIVAGLLLVEAWLLIEIGCRLKK